MVGARARVKQGSGSGSGVKRKREEMGGGPGARAGAGAGASSMGKKKWLNLLDAPPKVIEVVMGRCTCWESLHQFLEEDTERRMNKFAKGPLGLWSPLG